MRAGAGMRRTSLAESDSLAGKRACSFPGESVLNAFGGTSMTPTLRKTHCVYAVKRFTQERIRQYDVSRALILRTDNSFRAWQVPLLRGVEFCNSLRICFCGRFNCRPSAAIRRERAPFLFE